MMSMPRYRFFQKYLQAILWIPCVALIGFTHLSAQANPSSSAPSPTSPVAVGKAVSLSGLTTKNQKLDLSKLRGKVVMLFFWSTDCAVCLDKLPELRRNLAGWRGKDFVILAVNQDRHRSDLIAYEKVLTSAVPGNAVLDKQMQILWRKDPAYQDNLGSFPVRAATTLVLDRQGKVVNVVQGWVSNDIWDDIAAELVN
jgi:peroxiredoxin